MAPPKIMNGARAMVFLSSPSEPSPKLVGIFTSISYGLQYDAQPAYTLGAFAPREIDYTAQEPVQIQASGWRVINNGPHIQALIPRLQDLLNHEYLTMTVLDRQTDTVIATIKDVRPTGFQTPIANRQMVEQSFSFIGRLIGDETPDSGGDEPGAAVMP